MNYKLLFLSFILFLFYSCKKESTLIISEPPISETFSDNCNTNDCTQVTINYIKTTGSKTISEKVNKKITAFIVHSLLFDVEDVDSLKQYSISQAANYFIESYKKDKAEFPDITTTYSANISVIPSYTSKKLFCFEMQQFLFTGGAHGFGSVNYLNIDPATGELLTIQDFCRNKTEFTHFIEQKFRNEMEIPKDQTINSQGFWFDNDIFYLPKTIGFTKEELIIVYNPYEIASYAAGAIELRIQLKEAIPYLTIY
ncbi:MAG: DUF3298 domain-containing protein [Flavobacteriales bacterium]